jgi:hypothetical protein
MTVRTEYSSSEVRHDPPKRKVIVVNRVDTQNPNFTFIHKDSVHAGSRAERFEQTIASTHVTTITKRKAAANAPMMSKRQTAAQGRLSGIREDRTAKPNLTRKE